MPWFAVAGVAGVAPGGAAAQGPDYRAYTATQLIPFARDTLPTPLPFTHSVSLSFRVGERTVRGTMDTGTTGVIIADALVPPYDPAQATPGWEFLSSSKVLWTGNWVRQDLVFLDWNGDPVVTSNVPVLAVEQEVRCPGYKASYGGTCPASARVWTGPDTTWFCRRQRSEGQGSPCYYPITRPDSLVYIGVGFGREYDGQPQGTPEKNPLLNITAIAGNPVQPETMRSGYIITARGVLVGLTRANTAGFSFSRLQPRMVADSTAPGGFAASTIARDWGPATACISVDGAQCASAHLLVDTGVDEMFLTPPASMTVRTDSVPDPSLHGHLVRGLAQGSQVDVCFPGTQTPAPVYSFRVGDHANRTTPSVVIIPDDSVPFVNTGRHFLRAFDVLLDADGGWFGVRAIPGWRDPYDAPAPCAARTLVWSRLRRAASRAARSKEDF